MEKNKSNDSIWDKTRGDKNGTISKKELKKREEIECIVCVTAQHRQMLDQVLETFEIVPEYDLDIMKQGQTLSQITSRVLEGLEKVIQEVKAKYNISPWRHKYNICRSISSIL